MQKKEDVNENNNSINQALLSDNTDTTSLSSITLDLTKENYTQNSSNNNSAIKSENDRFTKHSPLVTLLIMSVGPLSNLLSVVFETLNMYFISKRFNQESSHAVEIIGFSAQIQALMILIGNFFGQCFVTRVSALIGSGERERAAQLCSDLFKLTFIISIIFSILMGFIVKPFLHFVGTPSNIMNTAFKFNLFQLIFNPFSNLYTMECCFLQSIGNSILLGIVVVISKIVQSVILTPFFLFVCKVDTIYMKLSTVVVDFLFSTLFFIFVFIGKFSLKPTFRMFFTFKISKDTINSLLYPLPYMFLFIGNCVSPMVVLKCLTSNNNADVNQEIGGVYAVFNQIFSINQALISAIVLAFMSTGNHAFGSNNILRLKKLLFWSLVISLSISIVFSFAVIVFKTSIASWFINDKDELDLASKMLPIPFYTSFLLGVGLLVYASLLVIKKPGLSMIPLVLQIVILCAGSEVLKLIFKDDFIKIFHIYNCSDIICFIVFLAELIYVIWFILKKEKENINISLSSNN